MVDRCFSIIDEILDVMQFPAALLADQAITYQHLGAQQGRDGSGGRIDPG
jgi:hypothetical protein